MERNLNPQQFTHTAANSNHTTANGQERNRTTDSSSTENSGGQSNGTQTVISIRGTAPNISTRA